MINEGRFVEPSRVTTMCAHSDCLDSLCGKAVQVSLPTWLDNLIYGELGASFCRENCNMTVIDWSQEQIRRYLGTYFPRSYAEAYCIFSEYFKIYRNRYAGMSRLSILDFGCGTGGETLGLIAAIGEQLPQISQIRIKVLDGNRHALRLFERIFHERPVSRGMKIDFDVFPNAIDDVYDLDVAFGVLRGKFDFILSFKAICEMVSKRQFDERNPYSYVVQTMLPKLAPRGRICLADVSVKIDEQWLPKIMDVGIEDADAVTECRNLGFNEAFYVTHSQATADRSKIAWRIIRSKTR